MEDATEEPDGLEDAAAFVEQLSHALLVQLREVKERVPDSTSGALAAALTELHDRLEELMDLDLRAFDAADRASLQAIADATDRIERARRRIADAEPSRMTAEQALRAWSNADRDRSRNARPDDDRSR